MIYDYDKAMKIFIFGLVIVFFIFKLGFWSNAYSDTVLLGPIEEITGDISSAECREILNNGNIMENPNLSKGKQFWTIIYNNKTDVSTIIISLCIIFK